MSLMDKLTGVGIEKMSNFEFRVMLLMFKIYDFFTGANKNIGEQLKTLGVKEGLAVVDYGCGPGRYTIPLSSIIGERGMVYAVDIHEMAIEKIERIIEFNNLKNVKPVLAEGYSCSIPNQSADMICALDVFHMIQEPTPFLKELHRMIKKKGMLIIDDGHQKRQETKDKIIGSNVWNIVEETDEYLKCIPQ